MTGILIGLVIGCWGTLALLAICMCLLGKRADEEEMRSRERELERPPRPPRPPTRDRTLSGLELDPVFLHTQRHSAYWKQ